MRSVTTAVNVEVTMAMRVTTVSDSRKLDSHHPAAWSLSEVMNPDMAPTMKTSPWAKLMNPKTP